MASTDPNDPLVTLVVEYLAIIASDLTKGGISWLSRKLNRQPDAPDATTSKQLNTSLQAALVERGVDDHLALMAADFVLHRANLSHLILLRHAGRDAWSPAAESDQDLKATRGAFEEELRAHLVLEGGLPAKANGIDIIVSTLSTLFEKAAVAQISASQRRSIEISAATPSRTFLYKRAKDRISLLSDLGQPDLADFVEYTKKYNDRARAEFSELHLQHLGSNSPAVPIGSIYVQPTFAPYVPFRGSTERTETLGMKQALARAPRKVFLGPAGIGKSTFVRFTAKRIAELGADGTVVPFVIELSKYGSRADGQLFLEYLEEQARTIVQLEPPTNWVSYLLLTGRATVFFDGFDEVLELGDRSKVRLSISAFAALYSSADIIVTSRKNGYDAAPFASAEFAEFEVQDFDEGRVRRYSANWFSHRAKGGKVTSDVEAFLAETATYASELRENPLMLSLLCNVYYYKGDIPRSLSELYERCASMMFQEWDSIRGIKDYGGWDKSLRPALYHLAWTILNNASYRGLGVPKSKIEDELRRFWMAESIMDADQASQEARRVIDLWTGRAWMVTVITTDDHNRPLYGFVHQSFLEYFAGVAISRASDSPRALLDALQNRILLLNGWSVAQMAVSVFDGARSQGGSRFVAELVDQLGVLSRAHGETMLEFAISLLEIVELTRQVEQKLVEATLSIYSASLRLPSNGMTLATVHQDSRSIHESVESGTLELEELGDDDLLQFVPAALDSENDYPLSTIETERSLGSLVDSTVNSDARAGFFLEVLKSWSAAGGERTMVTAAFAGELFKRARPGSSHKVDDCLRSMADALSPGPAWIFFAACFAAGISERATVSQILPWNVQPTRESLVLSMIIDFDVPVTAKLKSFGLLTDPWRLEQLQAIGRSFLAMWSSGVRWDLVRFEEPEQMTLKPRGTARTPPSAWNDDALAGAFVVFGILIELHGDRAIQAATGQSEFRNDEKGPDAVDQLGQVMVGNDLLAPDIELSPLLKSAIAAWRLGKMRLSSGT